MPEPKNGGKKFYTYMGTVAVLIITGTVVGLSLASTKGSATITVETGQAGIVVHLLEGTELLKSVVSKGDRTELSRLHPGSYSVLVYREGTYPWKKDVFVPTEYFSTVLRPFHVPLIIAAETVSVVLPDAEAGVMRNNAEYDSVMAALRGDTAAYKTSRNGNTVLVREGKSLIAEWRGDPNALPGYFCKDASCASPLEILAAAEEIRGFDFFPGREDVALFASGPSVYALEFDKNTPQNLQPLFAGNAPLFHVAEDGRIYVYDAGTLARLMIN